MNLLGPQQLADPTVALAFFGVIVVLGLTFFICWIVYWIQMAGYGRRLRESRRRYRRGAVEEDYDDDYRRPTRRDEWDDDDEFRRSRRGDEADDRLEDDRPRRNRDDFDDRDDDRPRRKRDDD